MPRLLGGGVQGGEVVRDVGMGVEGVDGVEVPGQGRALLGQVGRRAAAQDQDVDVLGVRRRVGERQHRNIRGQDRKARGVAAGEHRGKGHVRLLAERQLHAAAEVAVSADADAIGLHLCKTS